MDTIRYVTISSQGCRLIQFSGVEKATYVNYILLISELSHVHARIGSILASLEEETKKKCARSDQKATREGITLTNNPFLVLSEKKRTKTAK